MKNKTGALREAWTLIMSRCYSQELSACPKHTIFQPQKAINLLLKACKDKGLKFVPDNMKLPENTFKGQIRRGFDNGVLQTALMISEQIEEIDIEENTD